jgi:hypothetical protein
MDYKAELDGHSLTYLKTLAKQQYGLKVAKLNKKQLVVAIVDAVGNGKPKTDKIDLSKDVSKMKKNELIIKLQTKGVDAKTIKGKSKEELLKLYKTHSGDVEVEIVKEKTTKSLPTITSIPITKEQEKSIMGDKKFTIKVIRDILKHFKIEIPKKLTLRKDIVHLLVEAETTKPTAVQKPIEVQKPKEIQKSTETPKPTDIPKKPKKKPTLTIETDIVALDDIDTPFSPVPIKDLLDEPSEKQLQEELYRCLTFYDHKPE